MAIVLRDPVEEVNIYDEPLSQDLHDTYLHQHYQITINRDPYTRGNLQYYKKPTYKCEKCGVTVTSKNVLQRHLMGRKHIQRVEREGKTFECDVCEIVANGQTQLEAHLRSTRHKAQVYKKEHGHEIITKGAMFIFISIGAVFILLLSIFKLCKL